MTGVAYHAFVGRSRLARGLHTCLDVMMVVRNWWALLLRRHIDGEWLMALSGALSVAFGALILIAPLAGALAVVLLIGAYAFTSGVVLLALGIQLRRAARGHSPERLHRKAA